MVNDFEPYLDDGSKLNTVRQNGQNLHALTVYSNMDHSAIFNKTASNFSSTKKNSFTKMKNNMSSNKKKEI